MISDEDIQLQGDIKLLVLTFFGFILSIGLRFFLANLDDQTIGFSTTVQSSLNLTWSLIFFIFLWFEWLWTRTYLNFAFPKNRFHIVMSFIVQIFSLVTLAFCFFFFLQGDPSSNILLHCTEFWFILYLLTSIAWSSLNSKRFQDKFTLLNWLVLTAYIIFVILDRWQHFSFDFRRLLAYYFIGRIFIGSLFICLMPERAQSVHAQG